MKLLYTLMEALVRLWNIVEHTLLHSEGARRNPNTYIQLGILMSQKNYNLYMQKKLLYYFIFFIFFFFCFCYYLFARKSNLKT